jgi:nitrite reductase (NADH) large subunit
MHIVIIGAGAAGMSALDTIRKHDSKAKVTLISENMPISPFALAELVTGEIQEKKIRRFNKQYFDSMNINFINKKVTKIDVKSDQISIEENPKLKFNRLLLAPGAITLRLPIKGKDKQGVFYMTTLKEAKDIKTWISKRRVKNVVILGAGFTGLEAAVAIRKKGINVTIVEMLESLLPRMLDLDVANGLKEMLRAKGIKIFLNERAEEIQGVQKVEAVKTSKRRLKTDTVIITAGVRPNLEILEGSPIKTNLGIIVDEHMMTNLKNVYAAGDVIEFKDGLLGLRMINAIWPNAVEQGRIAAYNILGISKRFEGSDIVNIIDIFGTPVVAMGYMKSELKNPEEIVIQARDYFKLLVKDNRILGFQGIGKRALRYGGLIHSLMKSQADIGKIKPDLEKGKLKSVFNDILRPEKSS